MEIKKIGASEFRIKAKKNGVVVELSSKDGASKVEIQKQEENSKPMIFDRAGEYEVGGVGIVGVRTEGEIVFVLHLDGLAVTFLGGFNGELKEKVLDEMGPVDVLLANDGAYKLIKSINPSIVVPFGDEKKVADLIEKIGVQEVKQDKLTLGREDLPEETSVVVLG